MIKDDHLTTFSEVYYSEQMLNCTFKRKASYALLLERYTDTCDDIVTINSKKDTSNSVCHKLYFYKLRCIGIFEHDKPKIVVGIMISILVIITVVLFSVFYRYYNALSNNRFTLVKIDKNDRKKLYMEIGEEEQLTQEKESYSEKEVKVESKRNEDNKTGYQLAPADSLRSQNELHGDVKFIPSQDDIYVYQEKNKFAIELEQYYLIIS